MMTAAYFPYIVKFVSLGSPPRQPSGGKVEVSLSEGAALYLLACQPGLSVLGKVKGGGPWAR